MIQFIELIWRLSKTNSSNDKKAILQEYIWNSDIQKSLFYILNPYMKYGVSNDRINAYYENWKYIGKGITYNNVYDLLDDLANRNITWYDAINACITLINSSTPSTVSFLRMALDKDLGVQTWISLINKVFWSKESKLIPEFNVSLATKFDDCIKTWETLDFAKKRYVLSRKLDWIRCVTMFNEEWTDCRFFSREWNEFFTLNKIKEVFLDMVNRNPSIKNYVIDWEVCIMKDWMEDFKKIVWDIKRKDSTVKNPFYWIFDVIKKEDFLMEYGDITFAERFIVFWSNPLFKSQYTGVLQYSDILDEITFNRNLEIARNNNWEGLILRNVDAPYEWKRTKNMIKVKDFFDTEYEVVWIEEWKQPVLVNWVMVEMPVLARVNIIHKWTIVRVGSWFSLEEKLNYLKNPQDIIGKIITVRYFEETKDDNGNPSLRFPTFQGIRDYE